MTSRATKVPLERPLLPAVETQLDVPFGVAVVGPGALSFARILGEGLAAAGRPPTLLWVQIRHVHGFDLVSGPFEGELHLYAEPSALLEGLRSSLAEARAPIVGVGEAFAIAVRVPLSVWIADGASVLSLPAPLRAFAREAQLVLESPRPDTARALAERMAVVMGPSAP